MWNVLSGVNEEKNERVNVWVMNENERMNERWLLNIDTDMWKYDCDSTTESCTS